MAHHPPWDGEGPAPLYSPLIEAAARLAAQGHHGHFRKGEYATACSEAAVDVPLPAGCVPYITHLMGTMGILARVGAPDEVLAAALLHDYLEDVPDPDGPATIRAAVGDEVLRLVLEVTEEKRPELDSSETWPLRKHEQIQKMADNSEGAVLIKAADLLHNLSSLLVDLDEASDEESVWLRLNAGPDRQLWYFSSGLDAARERLGTHRLVEELERAVAHLRGRVASLEPNR
jgi:(p)ppGpp synthase/HD superfamily hydrolase